MAVIFFLDTTPKVQVTNEKMDKLNLLKNLKFCYQKTINRVKRQPTEWEKIFAIYISNKGLMSRIDRELPKLKRRTKQKQHNSKMSEGLE